MNAKTIEVTTAAATETDRHTGWPVWREAEVIVKPRLDETRVAHRNGTELRVPAGQEEAVALALLGVAQYRI